jgi:PAS domain S-box-containing protein
MTDLRGSVFYFLGNTFLTDGSGSVMSAGVGGKVDQSITWILSTRIASIVTMAIFLIIFSVEYFQHREQFTRYTIFSWAMYLANLVSTLIYRFYASRLLFYATLALTAAGAVFFLAAASSLKRRKDEKRLTISGISIFVVGLSFPYFYHFPVIATQVGFLVPLSILRVLTGILLFTAMGKGSRRVGNILGGTSQLLWGFYNLVFLLMREISENAPVFYQLGVFFELMTGVAIVVMLFERAELKAERNAASLDNLFNEIQDITYIAEYDSSNSGKFLLVNASAVSVLGYSQEELLSRSPADLEVSDGVIDLDYRLAKRGHHLIYKTYRCKDGRVLPVEVNIHRVEFNGRDTVLCIARDISGRLLIEEGLRNALREKESLLREIHHRVKNNLQVILSLLALQEGKMQCEEDVEALEGSRAQIYSMALVHEKLYASHDLSAIDMKDYLEDLVITLATSFGNRPGIVARTRSDSCLMPIDAAIPCGLIVVELVTNAYKHAFGERTSGEISVTIDSKGGSVFLEVRDDGCGLPSGVWGEKPSTFGLTLVDTLAKQLDSSFSYRSENGAVFSFEFAMPAATG